MKARFLVPFALFLALCGFLAVGLQRDPREIPSPLVQKAAPAFRVPQLAAADQAFSPDDMKGQVWMLNVWASWCTECRVEHPVLVQIARSGVVPVVGLDYKDTRAAALQFLGRQGDPYRLTAFDGDGRVGIDYGVYGVPETFIIDRNGVIRYKQIGPITEETMARTIAPLIERLKKS